MHHPLLHRFQLLCAALIAALFTPLVSAGPTDAAFRATIYISESVSLPTTSEPCVLVGTISGRGVATKLGAVTLASMDCINPVPPTFTSFRFASTEVMLKTMNGDEVFATYSGALSSDGVISGAYIIHGGTGRTINATGSGAVNGFEMIDFATRVGAGQIRLEGTISY
jgi:hypothetical protein